MVIYRTYSRSILADAAKLVNRVNSSRMAILSSTQCDMQAVANPVAAQDFIQNVDLCIFNELRTRSNLRLYAYIIIIYHGIILCYYDYYNYI